MQWQEAARISNPVRDGVSIVGERPRADQRRAALNAGMSDILEIVRRVAISVARGCNCRNLHPMSAMRAGEEESRQLRRGNVLVMHGALLAAKTSQFRRVHFPTDLRISQ
jgi:hypothetical protein